MPFWTRSVAPSSDTSPSDTASAATSSQSPTSRASSSWATSSWLSSWASRSWFSEAATSSRASSLGRSSGAPSPGARPPATGPPRAAPPPMASTAGSSEPACLFCGDGYDDAGHACKSLPCGHVCGRSCLVEWLRTQRRDVQHCRCWMPWCVPTPAMRRLEDHSIPAWVQGLRTLGDRQVARQVTFRQEEETLNGHGKLPAGTLRDLGGAVAPGTRPPVDGGAEVVGGTLLVHGRPVSVAVKRLPTRDARQRAAARREVALSAWLSARCPRVCRVLGYVEDGEDELLLVMERCERSLLARARELALARIGAVRTPGDLAAASAREGGAPGDEVARLAADLFGSLEELHRAGLVHCDIKPSNCLLRPDGHAVLTDFGTTQALDRAIQSGHRATVAYTAPEVLRAAAQGADEAAAHSPSSDVYALAGTLLHVASGRFLFPGEDDRAVADALLEHGGLGSPSLTVGCSGPFAFPDRVREPLRSVLAACLSEDPDARPRPSEVVRAAQEAGAPAPPPGALDREAVYEEIRNMGMWRFYRLFGRPIRRALLLHTVALAFFWLVALPVILPVVAC